MARFKKSRWGVLARATVVTRNPLERCQQIKGGKSLRKQPRRHHWFPREMRLRKEREKLHTNDVLLPRSGLSTSDWLK